MRDGLIGPLPKPLLPTDASSKHDTAQGLILAEAAKHSGVKEEGGRSNGQTNGQSNDGDGGEEGEDGDDEDEYEDEEGEEEDDAGGGSAGAPPLTVGDRVVSIYSPYRGKTANPWFAGNVTAVSGETCTVKDADGQLSTGLTFDEVFFAPHAPNDVGKGKHRHNSLDATLASYFTGNSPMDMFEVTPVALQGGTLVVMTDDATASASASAGGGGGGGGGGGDSKDTAGGRGGGKGGKGGAGRGSKAKDHTKTFTPVIVKAEEGLRVWGCRAAVASVGGATSSSSSSSSSSIAPPPFIVDMRCCESEEEVVEAVTKFGWELLGTDGATVAGERVRE